MQAEKLYSDACLNIFEDDAWKKIILVEVVVQRFRNIFDEVSSDEDIWQTFRIEESLLELDTKLRDFAETRIEVENYRKKVKDKYDDFNLLYVAKITKIIEKLKMQRDHWAFKKILVITEQGRELLNCCVDTESWMTLLSIQCEFKWKTIFHFENYCTRHLWWLKGEIL